MVRMLPSSSIMPSPPGFLVLRVQGSARDGQLVRLQSPKCTIGSGPNCTLRLRADNIGAVHCLILRGPSRTLVRRWSPDTRLNGRNFSESVLQAGDRLSIGAIDLEVVETEPGLKSATASSVTKPAKLETGLVVQVPAFINAGEKIRVDTSEGAYLSRA